MIRRGRLACRPPVAGDVLAVLPGRPSSLDVWGAEAMILRLSARELARLRYALAARMASEEYHGCHRHPLGGRPEPDDGRLHLAPQVVQRGLAYASQAGWERPEQLPWLCARWALLDARADGCAAREVREAADILAGVAGCEVAHFLPRRRGGGA